MHDGWELAVALGFTTWASAEKNSEGGKKFLRGKIFFRGNILLPEKSLDAISHKLLTGA